ncbi:hypothetical protein AVEN_151584-1 [Araneus ventricosus]|uniref:Integrase zinc-binding domain-containing protein n=1 Tax=Araneus ventricosus TaxID=182803 RepID=A0A4Y2HY05_ARAVE|nr:hypothetical protein AVEN_151584-1 [Araneus ventricosus]
MPMKEYFWNGKVFDPFGFVSPVILCPKLMLQKTWELSLGWDKEITGSLREDFFQLFRELEALKEVRVPRWINITPDATKKFNIHTFCGAIKDAYAAVSYLEQEAGDKNVHFLASRIRIAPLKGAMIPRLELLAALVGVRLTKAIVDALGWTTVKCFYWSDSTSVLTWITKEENWCVFVNNRVQEIRIVQKETFQGKDNKKLKFLSVYKDEDSIFRVKTKIIYRKDTENFRKPILLPSEHEVVSRLIRFQHEKNSHCGVQTLINILRETYWILSGKKSVRRVISSCVIGKRYSSQKLECVTAPLPENRVRDAAVFQITGIDTAGPLFLKDNQKVWALLFTCTVYRAVHLELLSDVPTEVFLMALRKFLARRGRCSTIYCDNGTNFVGAASILHSLDLKKSYQVLNS